MGDLSSVPSSSIASGVCTGVAIIMTVFRLSFAPRGIGFGLMTSATFPAQPQRCSSQFSKTLATISACALLAQLLVLFINPNQQNGAVRFYVLSDTLYTTIWFARLSILFSIIQIARTTLSPLRGLHISVALFLAAWVFLIGQLFWDCERKIAWKYLATPRCDVSPFTSVSLLVTDVIADGVLLYYPIWLFKTLQEKKLRYRLIVIFGTCVITIIPSVVHMVYSFDLQDKPSFSALVIKAGVSLIVCHIPTLAMAIRRLQEQNVPYSYASGFLKFRATFSQSQPASTLPAAEVGVPRADFENGTV